MFIKSIKKLKELQNNAKLDEIVTKFPENREICKNMLNMLDNKTTKIKEDNNSKDASLYIAITDTILIGNIKDKYYRIQTIAHECLHSVQSRKLLLFNFIYSNIYIMYFYLSMILTIFGIFKNIELQIIVLSLMGFLYYAVRSYLEIDAMIKAKYLAKNYMQKYIEEKEICSKEEVEEVINEYENINKIGIPIYNFILFFCVIRKIIILLLIIWLKNLF